MVSLEDLINNNMYTNEIIASAKQLKEDGLNWSQISRQLSINRTTLREWFSTTKRYSSLGNKPRTNDFFNRFHEFEDVRRSYYYILGQYLGDGNISSNSRTYRLRIAATSKYVDVITEIKNAMHVILPHNSIYESHQIGCQHITINSNHLCEIFPHTGVGGKHERLIELSEWQLKYFEENSKYLARGLFHSDGCRYSSNDSNTYFYGFANCSLDIHEIYQKCLTSNGIAYTFNRKTVSEGSSPAWNTLIYKQSEVKKAYEFLGFKS